MSSADDFDRLVAQVEHLLRLGNDAIELLEQVYNEVDLPIDLSIDVGTLLLRVQSHVRSHR